MRTKTAQFTPGPLHLNGTYLPTRDGIGDGNSAYICTADGRQLAQMYRKHPQAQAYAPMLAAAPTMYEALKRIKVLMESGDIVGRDWVEYGHIINALAHAEGRLAWVTMNTY